MEKKNVNTKKKHINTKKTTHKIIDNETEIIDDKIDNETEIIDDKIDDKIDNETEIIDEIKKENVLIDNLDEKKLKKNIIKNVLKGGFCSTYKDPCNEIAVKMNPIEPVNKFLNFILDIVQNSVLKKFTDGFIFIIRQWNDGITHLSTTLERFILLIIFMINGYTKTLNFMLDDIKLMLRILVVILTNVNPFMLLTIYIMPIMNELLSFILDSGTIDVVTALFSFNFTPIYNFIKAFLYLLIGKTIKGKCSLSDYGNNKEYMDSDCYEFVVPKCKLNLRTLYYITLVFIILVYVSSWISFLKLFYPD